MKGNNSMKKLLSIILLCTMLVPALASCADGNEPASADTTAANAETTTAAEAVETTTADPNDRTAAVSTLDESLDFGGVSINVGYVNHERYKTDIIGADDGDIINTAVYDRNVAVEEELNVKLKPVLMADSTRDAADKFTTVVLAGDDMFDVNSGHQSYVSKHLFEGLFQNMADDEYITWDSPWWADDYMKEFEIGDDKRYFLFGDIALMMLKSAGATYFNKNLYDKYLGKVDDFYADIMDGKWTLDMLYEYSQKSYADLNGDGTVNEGDLYGVAVTVVKSVEHLQYDAGIRTTQRNKDGIPEIILNNEKTITFAEKMYNLYYNNNSAMVGLSDADLDGKFRPMFKDDKLMFFPSWFYTAEYLRDMDSDFGIIPYPKLDEEQEEYMTLVHNGSTLFSVPVTITTEKLEIIGAVLESMAFNSYKTVTPAYFEVALKSKYTRDDVSSQLLDVMYHSMYTDFGYCYSSNLNGIGLLRNLAANKTADFSSWYAGKEAGALAALDKLIALYNEN